MVFTPTTGGSKCRLLADIWRIGHECRAAEEALRRLARLIGRQIARDQFRRACGRSNKASNSTESNR